MITNIEVATAAGYTRISADIAGESVWFRLPDQHFHGNVADALTCLAFFPAMARYANQPPGQLDLPEPHRASARLLDNLPLLQDIFRAWCPALQPFTHNLATRQTPPPVRDEASAQVGASFSGGVDSHYTMLRHASDISCLVHIDGFEFEPGTDASAQTIAALAEQAARYHKPLIVVETNALAFYRAFKLQRYLIFGAFLATVAHLLGLRRFLIPSSYAFDELAPGGSHALTDPLWSSEGVQLIHDAGIHHRLGKMRFLAERSDVLDHILVCWHDHVENCGHCNKCLRTRIGLHLLNEHPASFKGPLDMAEVRRMPVKGTALAPVLHEYMDLARANRQYSLLRALAVNHLRYNLREAARTVLTQCDDLVTGGRLLANRRAGVGGDSPWFELKHKTIIR